MADSKLDPNKSYGWTGKILRVNLTDKTVSVSPTDPYKEYLGGMGIANKIMYDEVPAGTDPLSPENKIVFAVGPLTATGVPLAGRTTIASLSTYTTDHQVVDAHTGSGDGQQGIGEGVVVELGGADEDTVLTGLVVGVGIVLRLHPVQAHGRNLVECFDAIHGTMPPGWSQRTTILAGERAVLAPLPPQHLLL